MNTSHPSISTCRHCQYYQGEGRRGGYCQQLCAPVQGSWKACYLAIPPFSPTWEMLPGITTWRETVLRSTDLYADSLSPDVENEIEMKVDVKTV